MRRAAVLLGGFDRLGERLHVPAKTLERWANELGAPSERQFLDLVDILEESKPATPMSPAEDPKAPAPPPPPAAAT